jgi:hypothetical protein
LHALTSKTGRGSVSGVHQPWKELVNRDDDAISLLRAWVSASSLDVEVLPVSHDEGGRTLEALQVTTRSPLGAVAFHTGGLLIDRGWLRVLGAGHERLPRSLDGWNNLAGEHRCVHGLLIADDVLGGFFAWFSEPRTVHFLAPDTLEWEDLGLGYTDWLQWSLSDRLAPFYGDLRWNGWPAEVATLSSAQGIHVVPPLVLKGPAIGERSRAPVPLEELWGIANELGEQLRGVPDGTHVVIKLPDE